MPVGVPPDVRSALGGRIHRCQHTQHPANVGAPMNDHLPEGMQITVYTDGWDVVCDGDEVWPVGLIVTS